MDEDEAKEECGKEKVVGQGRASRLYFGCPDMRPQAVGINPDLGATAMEWSTPQHEVVELNCEVSSYANAEL